MREGEKKFLLYTQCAAVSRGPISKGEPYFFAAVELSANLCGCASRGKRERKSGLMAGEFLRGRYFRPAGIGRM